MLTAAPLLSTAHPTTVDAFASGNPNPFSLPILGKTTVYTAYANQMLKHTAAQSLAAGVVNLPTQGEYGADIIALSSLDISKGTCGWQSIQANRSVEGNPLTLRGTVYTSGVGTHAESRLIIKLNGSVTRFVTRIGIDDEVSRDSQPWNKNGVVDYRISLQGQDNVPHIQAQGTIHGYDQEIPEIEVDCNGWKYLILEALEGEGGNAYDHVDWANAYFETHEKDAAPPVVVTTTESVSQLDCSTVVFSQPGIRFMHKLRATDPTATLNVKNLPTGLQWNERRQLVEGIVEQEGDYDYDVYITTDGQTETEKVTLKVSSSLQQPVPFMGWLSWNVVENEISDKVVKTTADALIEHGLDKAGYRYLVIDDYWHADNRDYYTQKPVPDPRKFPDGLEPVVNYVHDKGLKFGIYSDAGTLTCAKRFGSFGYEEIDAQQYADWKVDLLKYDYCNAPDDQQTARNRYKAMGDALKATGRNILFYMCEWGVREPWKWGHETGATCWRCTYDTRDGWNGIDTGYEVGIGILQSIRDMKDLWAYSGPNRFNDADMMCVGIHGKGKSSSNCVERAGMTQTEYRTQFALWCMWSSPLTLSFDLREPIDEDDLAIMTHEELIAIDQDRMGQQAELISENDKMVVLAKDLENGDVAISVTNLNERGRDFTFDFSKIGALDAGTEYLVRDLWEKKDLGLHQGQLSVKVFPHQTLVYRLSKKEATSIQSINDEDIKIRLVNGQIVIETGTENLQNKRILVSDLSGRIVAQAVGTGTSFSLPLHNQDQVYIVNITCGGKSHSVKVVR